MKKEKTYCFAVDLGATSGRTMTASFDGEKVELNELTRFPNRMIPMGGHLYWDLPALYMEVLSALKKVAQSGIRIESIGIDTWGCDFAFFGKDGQLLGLPCCYRDPHTEGAQEAYFRRNDKRELYEKTGIQFMDINSIFQLDTLRRNKSVALSKADKILFIPDALIYLLTGKQICEYTVASTSQLLNPVTGDLDKSVLKSIGMRRRMFGKMTQPGTVVGTLSEQVRNFTGLDKVKVVAVAGHDTASAVAAVPAGSPDFAYLSCGTWSLMGVETKHPVITDESFGNNYTNEGGIDGTTRFLKNICGLWLLERCRAEWGGSVTSDIGELSALCEQSSYDIFIDPDDPSFAHPESMLSAIALYCQKNGLAVPESPADYVRCIFRSLARRYGEVLKKLSELTGNDIKCLHVIGGGSLNPYLMQYTANELHIPVIAGPAEGTAMGNALLQLRATGKIRERTSIRTISAKSVNTVRYEAE